MYRPPWIACDVAWPPVVYGIDRPHARHATPVGVKRLPRPLDGHAELELQLPLHIQPEVNREIRIGHHRPSQIRSNDWLAVEVRVTLASDEVVEYVNGGLGMEADSILLGTVYDRFKIPECGFRIQDSDGPISSIRSLLRLRYGRLRSTPRGSSPRPAPVRRTSSPGRASPPGRASGASRVVAIRAPLAPSGWPIAIAPPRVLTLLLVDAQQLEHGQDLHGERLVELDALDLIERQPGALQGLVDRRHRPDAHLLGVDPGDGHGADRRHRLEAQLAGLLLRHDQDRRRPDVDRRAVARRHRAPFGLEGRRQRRQRLERGVAADALVRRSAGPCGPTRRVPRSG